MPGPTPEEVFVEATKTRSDPNGWLWGPLVLILVWIIVRSIRQHKDADREEERDSRQQSISTRLGVTRVELEAAKEEAGGRFDEFTRALLFYDPGNLLGRTRIPENVEDVDPYELITSHWTEVERSLSREPSIVHRARMTYEAIATRLVVRASGVTDLEQLIRITNVLLMDSFGIGRYQRCTNEEGRLAHTLHRLRMQTTFR